MRRLLAAAAIGACLIGAALAQDEPPPDTASNENASRFVADVERRPAAGQMTGPLFPTRALQRRRSGVAHLCCTARDDRSLDCEIALEWPENYGFGDSALRIASVMQITEESYQLYLARPDARVHMPVRFEISPLSEEFTRDYDRIRLESQALCGVNNGPMEATVVTGERIGRSRR